MEFKDQLSWSEFFKESSKEKIIKDVKPFNRLIAHSKNFFIVAGYGAFTEGYVLIITKDFIPSFGLLENHMLEEVNFLLELLKLFGGMVGRHHTARLHIACGSDRDNSAPRHPPLAAAADPEVPASLDPRPNAPSRRDVPEDDEYGWPLQKPCSDAARPERSNRFPAEAATDCLRRLQGESAVHG